MSFIGAFLISLLCIKNSISSEKEEIIFVVTTTQTGQNQLAELIRLGNSLNLVKNIHWIIVSGSKPRPEIKDYLGRLKIKYSVLTDNHGDVNSFFETSLKWIYDNSKSGIVMFCNANLVFDTRIFPQMLSIKQVGMWTIGRATKEAKFQVVFNLAYLFDKGFPHLESDRENNNIVAYLKYLQTKHNSTHVQIQDDKNGTEIYIWRNLFDHSDRADKRTWKGYEHTNMDALDSQIY